MPLTNGELTRADVVTMTRPSYRQVKRIKRFVTEFNARTHMIIVHDGKDDLIEYASDFGVDGTCTTDHAKHRREHIHFAKVNDSNQMRYAVTDALAAVEQSRMN